MRNLLLMICFFFIGMTTILANDYAYIYIQGDKNIPFYVKMDGKMLPRLGKNYCIIPNLDKGVIQIEILFQQNAYPAQKFALQVPEAGGRALVLQKVSDQSFSLFDLHSKNTIQEGNSPSEDLYLPPSQIQANNLEWGSGSVENLERRTQVKQNNSAEIPAFEPQRARGQKVKEVGSPIVEQQEDRRFLEGIEFNTNESAQNSNITSRTVREKKQNKKGQKATFNFEEENEEITNSVIAQDTIDHTKALSNTDCSDAMSNMEFESFAIMLLDKQDEEAQLKFLRKFGIRKCYTTEQVRILARSMDTQSGRFEVVKILYPRVVDQKNYAALESLFNTQFLKDRFNKLL